METLSRLFRRLLTLVSPSRGTSAEWPDTVGPELDEHPVVPVIEAINLSLRVNNGTFSKGIWSEATYKPMHPARLGRGIIPRTLIVHTTDMRPGTFAAVVKSWTTQAGKGNGAHFLIGKSAADGVVQFAPVHVNANHAGGKNCGGFLLPDSSVLLNPNTVAVGVELDNAGKLKKDGKGWFHPDTGHRFAAEDVFVDEKGRGWEKVTQYQLEQLRSLWTALKPTLKPWPPGSRVVPNATYASQGAQYAEPASVSLTGHASTNPINKTDPGPQVMKEINSWS